MAGPPEGDQRDPVQLRAGVSWRDLPGRYGPWKTAHERLRKRTMDGTWEKILAGAVVKDDAIGEAEWILSVDSTVVRGEDCRPNACRRTSITGSRRDRQPTAWPGPSGAGPSGTGTFPASNSPAEKRKPCPSWTRTNNSGCSAKPSKTRTGRLHHRAAAVLLLLYAQPLTRIASMRTDQISRTDDGETVVTFDSQPSCPSPLRRNASTPRRPAERKHRSQPRLGVALSRLPPGQRPPDTS